MRDNELVKGKRTWLTKTSDLFETLRQVDVASGPFAIERHMRLGLADWGGLERAIWDAIGKIAGQPVYRLLGGPVRDRIRVYNSCGNPKYGPSEDGEKGWPGMGPSGPPSSREWQPRGSRRASSCWEAGPTSSR